MPKLNDPSVHGSETPFTKILPPGRLLMNPYERMRDPFENKKPFFSSATGRGDDNAQQERIFWGIQAP